jgi:transposase
MAILEQIIEEYKEQSITKERDWRTYEQQVMARLSNAFKDLKPIVEQAVCSIKIKSRTTKGNKPVLSVEQKLLILLLKQLIDKSNRNMACMLVLFSWLSNLSVGYKTIERLYSDEQVILALHNLHILILRKKGITEADCTGDGTGYSLLIRVHYASEAQKLKDKVKDQDPKKNSGKKIKVIFSFALMDIKTRMYIAYGTGFKSEQEAFYDAVDMASDTGIKINSIRLDRYYSKQCYVQLMLDKLGKLDFYLIPKKNATIKGPTEWKEMLGNFVEDHNAYLKEYYQRNQSESGFAEDKKRTGWKLGQKRPERIGTALTLRGTWHNLCWLNC